MPYEPINNIPGIKTQQNGDRTKELYNQRLVACFGPINECCGRERWNDSYQDIGCERRLFNRHPVPVSYA